MELSPKPIQTYLTCLENRGLLAAPVPADLDRSAPVALVSYDSRAVVPGTLFLCKGAHFRPEFLEAAREQGAFAYVSETPYPQASLPCIQVTDMRQAIAPLADLFYDHPSGKLKVIGLTGTKGKSSTAYYLKYILDEYMAQQGKPDSGIISSIDTYDGGERFESHLTTPEPLELQRHFANALDHGLEYLTMEVSSQALKYHRTLCTDFAAACFLNIGQDHISPIEHPDFEDYFASKLRIFQQGAVNCVNLDCDHADRVLEAAKAAGKPVFTFSRKNQEADVYAAQVRKRGGRHPLPGAHPAVSPGVPADHARAVQRGKRPGRHLRVRGPGHPRAVHLCGPDEGPGTRPDGGVHQRRRDGHRHRGLRPQPHVLRDPVPLRPGGVPRPADRQPVRLSRREGPGPAAGPGGGGRQYADLVVLTEEDSGEEDTLDICREVAGHVAAQNCEYSIEPNRGEAIRQAILGCREPSVLLITGKGAETRQKRGREYVDTPSDVDYVQAFLREYDVQHGLDGMEKVRSLLSLLPILKRHEGKTVVVKYGGAAIGAPGPGGHHPGRRGRPADGGDAGGAGPRGRQAHHRPAGQAERAHPVRERLPGHRRGHPGRHRAGPVRPGEQGHRVRPGPAGGEGGGACPARTAACSPPP